MKNNQQKKRCAGCGDEVPSYDGVHLTAGDTHRFLCSECYNRNTAEAFGFDFEHLSFQPVTLEDRDGEEHAFHFQTRLLGDLIYIQALEIKEGEPKGYKFAQSGYAEDDLFGLFTKLVERLTREMERKHIEADHFLPYSITGDDIVRGRVSWDEETGGEVPLLVIDGKELSWHEFGRMLMTYEGFHFKLEIFDETEER